MWSAEGQKVVISYYFLYFVCVFHVLALKFQVTICSLPSAAKPIIIMGSEFQLVLLFLCGRLVSHTLQGTSS